jgi:DNA modification methylase
MGDTKLGDTAFTQNRDEPLHRWVPWIAGFSSSFVATVLEASARPGAAPLTVLDPFAGVGTTLVEAAKRGCNAIGFEINPYAALVSRVKVECPGYGLEQLRPAVQQFRQTMDRREGALPCSPPPAEFTSRVPFFSPRVERKVLHVLDFLAEQEQPWLRDVVRVALGATMVGFSNYSYEPSLGRRQAAGKEDILDADVAGIVAAKLDEMVSDMAELQRQRASVSSKPSVQVYGQSFLHHYGNVPRSSIDVLITSPPYLNNYHYIRNTRPHLFWLGLVKKRSDLRDMEQTSFGKFWQTVRSGPEVRLEVASDGLADLLGQLRRQNPERGVYGGSGWANYAATYFNDCLAFCRAARALVRPGGTAVVVIGNNVLQGIELRTDEHFAEIARSCGFTLVGMHPVRRKRTGTSIIRSSVRVGSARQRVELYETAVELKA